MDIQLYNSITKNKEIFKPLKNGHVGMYHCGPTVYDRAHIGNLRSYVFADTLRRVFEYNGYIVKQVVNITDVGHLSGENSGDADRGEDKMTKALLREGLPLTLSAMRDIGTKYFDFFVEDLKELHIEIPHSFPRASDTINDDVNFISQLERKGFTYLTSDGVYFDTTKFPAYGKLGGVKESSSNEEQARVVVNSQKKNPRDFAVWKLASVKDEKTIGWDSPWGRGFPGWHIECSVMSRMELGQPFDIHTGGIDHISVHHNNEIAQSEAVFDKPLANYWMHNAFVTIKKAKMAKSEGNYITLQSLEEDGISPLAYRYWLLTGHYRTTLNFTYSAVESAQKALIRLLANVSSYPPGGKISLDYKNKFLDLINNDLDTPQAIALMWDLIKDKNISTQDKRATILDFDQILGLNIEAVPHISDTHLINEAEIPLEINALAEARSLARKSKEWAKADAIRQEIQDRGFDVVDNDNGYSIIAR